MLFPVLPSLLHQDVIKTPVIQGPWWNIAGNPDLGELTTNLQQPVDFAIWQAKDGTWQLWSCIRGTKEKGLGRLLFRWEGRKLTDEDWQPKGVAMRADPTLGEHEGGLQAPHVVKWQGKYWMIYGSWDYLCLATSEDGKTFKRYKGKGGKPQLFGEAIGSNPRDGMSILDGKTWYAFYTAFPEQLGKVYVRTSQDFLQWSDSKVVAFGGDAGTDIWSAECPHVVKLGKDAWYLFRTQKYGDDAITRVYFSRNPFDFGLNNDYEHLLTRLPICAPELARVGKQWFIAALRPDLKGIRVAKLMWQ